jgi:hypothetical protein
MGLVGVEQRCMLRALKSLNSATTTGTAPQSHSERMRPGFTGYRVCREIKRLSERSIAPRVFARGSVACEFLTAFSVPISFSVAVLEPDRCNLIETVRASAPGSGVYE